MGESLDAQALYQIQLDHAGGDRRADHGRRLVRPIPGPRQPSTGRRHRHDRQSDRERPGRTRRAWGADHHRCNPRRRGSRARIPARAGSILPDGLAAAPARRRIIGTRRPTCDRSRSGDAGASLPRRRASRARARGAVVSKNPRCLCGGRERRPESPGRAAVRISRPASHAGAMAGRGLDPDRPRDVQHAAGTPGVVRTIARRVARHAARADVSIPLDRGVGMGNTCRRQSHSAATNSHGGCV